MESSRMNTHYINRYNNFIEQCKIAKRQSEHYESHHIIPKSMGGTDDSTNIIVLTAREHYIAHWILAHAYGNKMWYAFWMMNTDTRCKHYRYNNSRGYETAKGNARELVSESMKGKVTCYDNKLGKNVMISTEIFHAEQERYSHVSKGKATYVYKGKHVQLPTDHPLVLNGEAVSIRVGYKHKDSTKQKMSEHGIKNRIAVHNKLTGETKYIKKEDITDEYEIGFTKERSQEIKKRNKKIFLICKWITNGIENKRVKIESEEDIPEGWHIGRTIEKRTCEYCGKTVDVLNFAQHHGINCKFYKGDTNE